MGCHDNEVKSAHEFSLLFYAFFVFSIVMCTTTVAGLSTTQEFLPPARFAVVHCWRGLRGEEAWCQASFFGWPVSEQLGNFCTLFTALLAELPRNCGQTLARWCENLAKVAQLRTRWTACFRALGVLHALLLL